MRVRNVFVFVFVLMITGCSSKFVVKKLPVPTEGQSGNGSSMNTQSVDGIVYALPRTAIRVTVPVVRIDSKRGLYSEFAELFFLQEFLNDDVVAEDGTSFKLDKPGFV